MRVDPETGELHDLGPGCENCTQATAERIEAEVQLRGVERELTRQLQVNTGLRNELAKQRMDTPDGKAAKALGRYWIIRLGKNGNTKVKDKRLKAVLGRLRDGYEPTFIARAIDGAAEAANTDSRETQRLALIRVMQEAVRRLPREDGEDMKRLYLEAMKDVARYDDLELICRDETYLERFHALAERVKAPTLVGPAWQAEFEGVKFEDRSPGTPF